MVRGHGVWTTLVAGVAALVLLSGVAFGLQSPIKPKIVCPTGPTAAKTQAKLWFNDGTWWGVLFDGSSEEHHIYRYDRTKDAWSDTGTLVDARNSFRADTLWDGSHLSTWSEQARRQACKGTAPASRATVTIPRPNATRSIRASP
jgi:hypothetical protein